ncbi:MAG: pyruvate dehydrogenase (acetyl-transferring), homodimeric type [Gemmataceae bacterium]|nr:pyruvate dehydrogenase (acetyl-transferring), homodimeric type [Gemmataceae bacterium]
MAPASLYGNGDLDTVETKEWLDSLDSVLRVEGPERGRFLLEQLRIQAARGGVNVASPTNTPYINTIPVEKQVSFPGDLDLERQIKSLARWNAMVMVVRANKVDGLGGHIATYASSATLYEVAFNHFFRGPDSPGGGDHVYFQGHATPGIYARAFLEGRLSETQLKNFRRELAPGGGLSSYPHPWLMDDFWQYPTVSMGLGPIMAIYHARFLRYLEHRGIKDTSRQHVWAFLGDGECDEPESLGAIWLASRETLDNLIFVVNCNLQRLDGPVRGNGKIIQELETVFKGAGWNVIKVIWGSEWDPLLAADHDGLLAKRMGEAVDGEYQRYRVETGAYIREHFFGKYPELRRRVEHMSDEQLTKLKRGGHDPVKVYNAYRAAANHTGSPTVILMKTVKGYGMGEAGEGRNIAHQAKKIDEEARRTFRDRFNLPLTDEQVRDAAFYRPADDSPEIKYLRERRQALGGMLPRRTEECAPITLPGDEIVEPFAKGSGGRPASTTMVFVDLLKRLIQNKDIGQLIVPIIPDEARTFGMESMFATHGIYSNVGQLYEPVDFHTMLRYKEAKNGQILEEGITEAGAMSSFIAAGSSYSSQGVPMIPFYIFYSMFGPQRIGDLIWAAGDQQTRGFLIGGTAGRTTLVGEGLQHQDGHSHVLAATVPNLVCYDPAFAFEIALIIQDGLKRMYHDNENVFYYLTVGNENYPMEPMPDGCRAGVLKGMYKFRSSGHKPAKVKTRIHLLGSGSLIREALRAQQLLADSYGIAADVWNVTSYKELRRDALACERWNRLHPTAPARKSYLETLLANEAGVFIAVSDYMKIWAEFIHRWIPGGLIPLGTDGFGPSENRKSLRRYFEVDAEFITLTALDQLARRGDIKPDQVAKAIQELGIDPEKADPVAV